MTICVIVCKYVHQAVTFIANKYFYCENFLTLLLIDNGNAECGGFRQKEEKGQASHSRLLQDRNSFFKL